MGHRDDQGAYHPDRAEIEAWKRTIRRDHLVGKTSVMKGKRGEDLAAALLAAMFDVRARRGRTGRGEDVEGDLPIHVEVKNWARQGGPVFDAVDQAANDCGDKVPVAMIKNKRREFLLCLRASDLWRLFDAIKEYR